MIHCNTTIGEGAGRKLHTTRFVSLISSVLFFPRLHNCTLYESLSGSDCLHLGAAAWMRTSPSTNPFHRGRPSVYEISWSIMKFHEVSSPRQPNTNTNLAPRCREKTKAYVDGTRTYQDQHLWTASILSNSSLMWPCLPPNSKICKLKIVTFLRPWHTW